MDDETWKAMSGFVANQMKAYTRTIVTPLVFEEDGKPPRIGTGTYVETSRGSDAAVGVVTCEHVTRYQPLSHSPFPSKNVLRLTGTVVADPEPIDASIVMMDQEAWQSQAGEAELLPLSMLSQSHNPVPDELLFFRGIADENAYVGYGGFDGILTGYCSQIKRGTGDDRIFELFWEPEKTQIAPGTEQSVRERVKFNNAEGFSGSLVWNTRFVELGCDVNKWKPADAVVTGMLKRWDPKTMTLLALRVEHINAWLTERLSSSS
ncbi:hypothetical protein [Shinella kummerowiae]|uniref:hypothetical protein n=1 Tax=Shinella kummerowiae TaxID=417745 RepID=UPI0021B50754|nr:hypothetical protein [Shinella kummerowiae]MCT7667415.1 hypothetical protein [Shinella kummerowiae]